MFPRPELLRLLPFGATRKTIAARPSGPSNHNGPLRFPEAFSAGIGFCWQIFARKTPKIQHFSCHRSSEYQTNVCQAAQSRKTIQHADQAWRTKIHLICCLKLLPLRPRAILHHPSGTAASVNARNFHDCTSPRLHIRLHAHLRTGRTADRRGPGTSSSSPALPPCSETQVAMMEPPKS